MKAIVAYMSKTGNTRKVAEAIFSELDCEKELKSVDSVSDIAGYDVAFLGFPTHQYGPDKKTKEYLESVCTGGRKVALFVTHAAPEDDPEVPEWMEKFKKAASSAELVGFYDCQGELASGVKLIMKLIGKKTREQARRDSSQGQPDESRLAKARVFARETLSRCSA